MLIMALSFLLLLAIVMFSIALGVAVLRANERKKVRGFLAQLDEQPVAPVEEKPAILKVGPRKSGLPFVEALDRLALQSGVATTSSKLVLTSAVLATVGSAIGFLLRPWIGPPLGSLVLGGVAATLPILRIRAKRAARIAAFEAQFPDALEFLSRSMLAGHGFSISLNLLTAEASEPLASVFRLAANELHLGSPLERALNRISEQIPLVDVRFFVAAVLLQQATGGNLSEILNKLADVVRERFRLSGEVRAASAHGRLTSGVLMALPVLLTVALLIMQPDYLATFAHEPEGRFLLIAAVCGQVAGHTIIRHIVNIKV